MRRQVALMLTHHVDEAALSLRHRGYTNTHIVSFVEEEGKACVEEGLRDKRQELWRETSGTGLDATQAGDVGRGRGTSTFSMT